MTTPLNDSERQQLTDNYGLILFAANKLYPKVKDLMDIEDVEYFCTLAMIRAVRKFDPTRIVSREHAASQGQPVKFSYYAYLVMHTIVMREAKRLYKASQDTLIFYYDSDEDNYDIFNLYDVDGFANGLEDRVINKCLLDELLDKGTVGMNTKEKHIVYLYLVRDVPQVDIAKHYGLTRQRIGQVVTKFRNNCRHILAIQDLVA